MDLNRVRSVLSFAKCVSFVNAAVSWALFFHRLRLKTAWQSASSALFPQEISARNPANNDPPGGPRTPGPGTSGPPGRPGTAKVLGCLEDRSGPCHGTKRAETSQNPRTGFRTPTNNSINRHVREIHEQNLPRSPRLDIPSTPTHQLSQTIKPARLEQIRMLDQARTAGDRWGQWIGTKNGLAQRKRRSEWIGC